MSSKEGKSNARPIARQFVLSGWSNSIQSKDVYSDGNEVFVKQQEAAKEPNWQQEVFNVSVSLVLKQVSVDSDKHVYKILVNDDANLSMSAYSKRGKKPTSPTVTIPQKKGQNKALAMVYGVHEDGTSSFSHPSGRGGQQFVAELYSWLLGQIDNAIQYRLQQLERQEGEDDARERDKSTQPQTDLAGHQVRGRRKKIRDKVLSKTLPKETANMVEIDRAVLGNGHENERDRLQPVRDNSFDGTALEGGTLEF